MEGIVYTHYAHTSFCIFAQKITAEQILAHERVQLQKYSLEVSEVLPEDTNRLKHEFISVSWYYKVGTVGYYQFEVGTIESVNEESDGNNSRSVEVRYLREGDKTRYPVTLNRETFAPDAGHIPGKQYEWRMLKRVQHDDMIEKDCIMTGFTSAQN